MTDVLIDIDGPVAIVTIDRPDRRNALTVAGTQEVAAAIEEASRSSSVVVLTGAGKAFCAGGDFDELQMLSQADPNDAAERLYAGYQGLIRTIRATDSIVVAAINGHAMGAGMDLALCCDLRVASQDARLGQVWVKLGIIPGTGGAFWVSILAGPGRASQMLLTGEPVSAATALEWGLVNEVVPSDEVVPRAIRIGQQLAMLPKGALAANKRAIDEVIKSGYEGALSHAKQVQPLRFASEEFREALSAASKR